MLRLRALVATALLTALTVTVPSAAHAVPAADVTWSPVAPRHAGDGYPALGAPVDPWLTQVAADGAILFYDRTASRLRRIDPTTGVITALAGDGSPAAYCSPTYGADARTIAVPALQSVAAAANGDVVGIMAATYYCGSPGVIRLDHTDHQWHLVAQQPSSNDQYTLGYGGFGSVAVGPDGTVYVTDGFGHRVLAYAPGSAADAMGQVVAGTGTAGSAGDGGPATAAEVHAPRLAIGPGAVFLADGTSGSETTVVRRIDLATGVITRVAGTGNPYAGAITGADPLVGLDPLSADLTIEAFNVDPVSGLVALGLLRRSAVNSDIQHDLLAFAPGGTLVGVRTGLDVSNYTDPGIAVQHTGSRVLAYGQGELRAWRTSGADQGTAGSLVAGLGLSGSSASGVPLEDEFPGELTSIATSSTGAVALSGADGVRTLASLTPSSAVTVVSSERANAVDYASDGTLWWARDTNTPALVRKAPGGASVVVAGGGAGALVDGAVATSVALPTIVDVAADSSTGTTYFLAQSGADNPTYVGARFPQLWSLTTADGKLHLVAGDGTSNRLVVDGQSAA
ncbi:MAG TPA: hypothetical protein VFL59_06690, partial [Candidatus Nanopelagicales bacterium]|nr:hypothetical protein [Candidatus Nanopelagicales bacterium]